MKVYLSIIIAYLVTGFAYGQSNAVIWSFGSDSKFEFNKIKTFGSDQFVLGGIFEDSLQLDNERLYAVGDDDIFLSRLDSNYEMESYFRFGDSERETLHDYLWYDNSLYVLFSFYDYTRILDRKLTSEKRSRNYAIIQLSENWELENVWQIASIEKMQVSTLAISENQINLILASEDRIFVNNQLISDGGIVRCQVPTMDSRQLARFSGPIDRLTLLQNDSLNFVCGLFEGTIELDDSTSIEPGTQFSNGFVLDFSHEDSSQLYEISSIDDVRLYQSKIINGQLQLIFDYLSNLDIAGYFGLFGQLNQNTSAVITYSGGAFDQNNSYNIGFEFTVLSEADIENKRFCGTNFQTNEGFLIIDSSTTPFVGSLYAECVQSVVDAEGQDYVLIETDRRLIEPNTLESSLNGNAYLIKLGDNLNTSVDDIVKTEPIYVYPNPTSSEFNIVGQKWSHAELYNMQAQLIQSFTYDNIINISNITTGKYLLVVYLGHKKLLSKVVIKL